MFLSFGFLTTSFLRVKSHGLHAFVLPRLVKYLQIFLNLQDRLVPPVIQTGWNFKANAITLAAVTALRRRMRKHGGSHVTGAWLRVET